MAYTQADLDNLKAALASGALSVEYAGRRTTFRSLADIRSIIVEIEAELSPLTATPRQTVGAYQSGLGSIILDPRRRGWWGR